MLILIRHVCAYLTPRIRMHVFAMTLPTLMFTHWICNSATFMSTNKQKQWVQMLLQRMCVCVFFCSFSFLIAYSQSHFELLTVMALYFILKSRLCILHCVHAIYEYIIVQRQKLLHIWLQTKWWRFLEGKSNYAVSVRIMPRMSSIRDLAYLNFDVFPTSLFIVIKKMLNRFPCLLWKQVWFLFI